jgi:competence protein ComEA
MLTLDLNRGSGRRWLVAFFIVLAQFSCSLQAAEVSSRAGPEQTKTVYLNSATAEELAEGLVGVGQQRAEAIVAYRQRVGDFRNEDELSQVRGIGLHILTANKQRISYAPSAGVSEPESEAD